MKKQDIVFIVCVVLFFLPFFISKDVFDFYKTFNHDHGMIMSFIKFAVLATLGEVIGLRIRANVYYKKGWGILPRAVVWGVLGLAIKISFEVYATGMPICIEYLGVKDAIIAFKSPDITVKKILVTFAIGAGLNLMFAPVFMVLHKVTDMHIIDNGGTIVGLFKPIKFSKNLQNMDWDVQWNFVFKKTIPLFWIPAHTCVFLLSADFRILAAALLSIVLGIILAIASLKQKKVIINFQK